MKIPLTQPCKPLGSIGGVKKLLGVAINSAEEVIVAELDGLRCGNTGQERKEITWH